MEIKYCCFDMYINIQDMMEEIIGGGYKYCPYCGTPINEIKIFKDADDVKREVKRWGGKK